MLTNFARPLLQKDLDDDLDSVHFSQSPKKQETEQQILSNYCSVQLQNTIQSQAVKHCESDKAEKSLIQNRKKIKSFLNRFQQFQDQYQSKRELSKQHSQNKQMYEVKDVPDISKKSRAIASKLLTVPINDRLHHSYQVRFQRNSSSENFHSSTMKNPSSNDRLNLLQNSIQTNNMLQQKFVKEYEELLVRLKGTGQSFNETILEKQQIQVILLNMGFLQYEIVDEKLAIHSKDYELINNVETFLVTKTNTKLSASTLLNFLLVIQGISSYQKFQNKDNFDSQFQFLQIQFQGLNYNRKQYQLDKRKQITDEKQQKYSFSPSISNTTKKLADKKRASIISKTNLSNATIHDIWNVSRTLEGDRMYKTQTEIEKQKLQECSFQPQLNQITHQINKIFSNQIPNSTHQRLYKDSKKTIKTYNDEQSLDSDKDCTFHPNINRLQVKDRKDLKENNPRLYNQVNRQTQLQKSKNQALLQKALQTRGYPGNIKDWTEHIQSSKKQLSKSFQAQTINTSFNTTNTQQTQIREGFNKFLNIIIDTFVKPLLYVDINIGDGHERIVIYPKQNLEEVVKDFSMKYKLDQKLQKQLKRMLEEKVRNILYPINEVQNSQNYDF